MDFIFSQHAVFLRTSDQTQPSEETWRPANVNNALSPEVGWICKRQKRLWIWIKANVLEKILSVDIHTNLRNSSSIPTFQLFTSLKFCFVESYVSRMRKEIVQEKSF